MSSDAASSMTSNSTPPSPVMLWAPFTWNMAPTITIASSAPENLLSTPIMSSMPGTTSARAIGICSSGGSPMFGSAFANPGLNLPIPCSMNITPTDALTPMNTASLSIPSLISAVPMMCDVPASYKNLIDESLDVLTGAHAQVILVNPLIMNPKCRIHVNVHAWRDCRRRDV